MSTQSASVPVPSRSTPADFLLRPFREFARIQASGGIVLLAAALAALIWANTPWGDTYQAVWSDTKLSIGVPGHVLTLSLGTWVNDLLMAVFFLLVGLEVKREILVGELASMRKAALPAVAAAGGMLVPGLIYAAVNFGRDTVTGWGVPVATDIAFALGVLALFGSRIPVSLKVFLTSLAIADDIGALLVIAFFYTEHLHTVALLVSGGLFVLLLVLNRLGFMQAGVYLLIGAVLWYFVHESGIHATIAGVIVAITVPARSKVDLRTFVMHGRRSLDHIEGEVLSDTPSRAMTNPRLVGAVHSIDDACRKVTAPLQRLEHDLHPWVAYLILPVFALANAGVAVKLGELGQLSLPVLLGIIAGLVVGKPVGIMVMCKLAVRMGFASLPGGVTWRHMFGVSLLAGIGFTMSLFISYLAFGDADRLDAAKIGVLAASFLAAIVGSIVLMGTKTEEDAEDNGQELRSNN